MIDPYGVYPIWHQPAFLGRKTAAAPMMAMVKPYMVERVHPVTVVLGSSVAGHGIDPASPGWLEDDKPVFNASTNGGYTDVEKQYLLHILAEDKPRLVVVILSLEDAFSSIGKTPLDLLRLRVRGDGTPNPDYHLAVLKDLVRTTFSFRALRDSLTTLLPFLNVSSNYISADGMERVRPADEPLREGLLPDIDWMARANIHRYFPWSCSQDLQIEPLKQMIDIGLAQGASVLVVVPPVHAYELEVRRQLGLDDMVRQWRRRLAVYAAAHEHVRLWDSRVSTQSRPRVSHSTTDGVQG